MKRAVFAIAIACAAIGCDPSDPAEYEPTYLGLDASTPVPEVEVCGIFAQNLCAVLRPCCAPSPFGFEETKCQVVARSICEARRQAAHAAGLSYDDAFAGICTSGLATLVHDCNSGIDVLADDPNAQDVAYACANTFHGKVPEGRVCDQNAIRPCLGVVGARIDCVQGVCTDQKHTVGDACGCHEQGCSNCGPFLACTFEGQCTALHHPNGATCSTVDAISCEKGAYCTCGSTFCGTTDPSVCVPLPTEGEPCLTGPTVPAPCATGYRCSPATSTCVVGKAIGETCSISQECQSGACQSICIPAGIVNPFICSGEAFVDESAGVVVATSSATPG